MGTEVGNVENVSNGQVTEFVDDRPIASVEDLIQTTSEAQSDIEAIELHSGMVVLIKPLTRKQALQFGRTKNMKRDLFEQKVLAMAMVQPKMTVAEVSKWQDRDKANGDIYKISQRIIEISGMKEFVKDDSKSK